MSRIHTYKCWTCPWAIASKRNRFFNLFFISHRVDGRSTRGGRGSRGRRRPVVDSSSFHNSDYLYYMNEGGTRGEILRSFLCSWRRFHKTQGRSGRTLALNLGQNIKIILKVFVSFVHKQINWSFRSSFLPAAQWHGHKEGGIGVGVGTFRSCSLFTSCLRHGLLEGGIGKLLGHLSPVPFILNGKPQSLN